MVRELTRVSSFAFIGGYVLLVGGALLLVGRDSVALGLSFAWGVAPLAFGPWVAGHLTRDAQTGMAVVLEAGPVRPWESFSAKMLKFVVLGSVALLAVGMATAGLLRHAGPGWYEVAAPHVVGGVLTTIVSISVGTIIGLSLRARPSSAVGVASAAAALAYGIAAATPLLRANAGPVFGKIVDIVAHLSPVTWSKALVREGVGAVPTSVGMVVVAYVLVIGLLATLITHPGWRPIGRPRLMSLVLVLLVIGTVVAGSIQAPPVERDRSVAVIGNAQTPVGPIDVSMTTDEGVSTNMIPLGEPTHRRLVLGLDRLTAPLTVRSIRLSAEHAELTISNVTERTFTTEDDWVEYDFTIRPLFTSSYQGGFLPVRIHVETDQGTFLMSVSFSVHGPPPPVGAGTSPLVAGLALIGIPIMIHRRLQR